MREKTKGENILSRKSRKESKKGRNTCGQVLEKLKILQGKKKTYVSETTTECPRVIKLNS